MLRAYLGESATLERQMRAVNALLLAYTALVRAAVPGHPGLSLTVFPIVGGYWRSCYALAERAAEAPALQLTPVDMPARAA